MHYLQKAVNWAEKNHGNIQAMVFACILFNISWAGIKISTMPDYDSGIQVLLMALVLAVGFFSAIFILIPRFFMMMFPNRVGEIHWDLL